MQLQYRKLKKKKKKKKKITVVVQILIETRCYKASFGFKTTHNNFEYDIDNVSRVIFLGSVTIFFLP